jgi:hypothetical protein
MTTTKPLIVHRGNGEYSTVQIGNIIETVWFPDEGRSEVIGRTYLGLAATAEKHIREYEAAK